MRDERQWEPVEVIWDQEVRAPASPRFPAFREQPFPIIPSASAESRPRATQKVSEHRERRDEDHGTRRGRGKPKSGRKKRRAQDFDDFDEA
jgi:hypothetical protein